MALAASALLLSDLGRRRPRPRSRPRVALFPWTSRPVIDDSVRGAVEALAARGYADGRGAEIVVMNPEGDNATAAAMVASIVGGSFDVAVSFGTLALQSLAGANRDGKLKHVFATVTDPAGAGVGISRDSPLAHPGWLAGIGTFQPVKEVFRLARRANPTLKKVGTVWCPCETNSEACLEEARAICAELGIELLEASVDTTSAVSEAARAVVSRGAEAIWIGGDNTVESAMSAIVEAARQGSVPVFANAPSHVDTGALFALGADYVEVGRRAGEIAASVLAGGKLSSVRIENVVPQKLRVNPAALRGLLPVWRLPEPQGAAAPTPPALRDANGKGKLALPSRADEVVR